MQNILGMETHRLSVQSLQNRGPARCLSPLTVQTLPATVIFIDIVTQCCTRTTAGYHVR